MSFTRGAATALPAVSVARARAGTNRGRIGGRTAYMARDCSVLRVPTRVFALTDYTFELPAELIAQEPAASRDASRLLHLRSDGSVGDHAFPDIVELLPPDAVVIANDTFV